MVLYNLFDIKGMLRTMELVIFNSQGYQSLTALDSLNNWSEVLLKLIVRKVDLDQLVILTNDLLTNDSC